MSQITESNTQTQPTGATASRSRRLDLYAPIHKALRQFMSHTLSRLGTMEVADAGERSMALDEVDGLLELMRRHLQHENQFIHTAIEARRAGAAHRTADDHVQHLESISSLEDEALALRHADEDQRAVLAQRLYRHLADFIGDNLRHMHVEETQNNAALWALYADDELLEIQERLLATVGPQEMALVLRWMAASLNMPELIELFGQMQATAPKPALDASLQIARSQLDDRRWDKLTRALGRAPAHGRTTC
jgi:hypothetical protein